MSTLVKANMGSDKNKCVKCKNAIKDTEVVLMCGLWCRKTFHNECLGLSNREALAIMCSKVRIKFHCEACEERLAIELLGGNETQEAKNLGNSVNLLELMQKLVKVTEELSSDNCTINSKLDTVISSNARLEEYLLQSPKRFEKQVEEDSANAVGYAGSYSIKRVTEICDRNNDTNSHDQIINSERMCRESEFQRTQDNFQCMESDFPEQVADGQQQSFAERYCLQEWDIPEDRDSTCDPLSIDEEECSPPESIERTENAADEEKPVIEIEEEKYSSSDGFLQACTLSTERTENVEDENNFEELKHEMGSTITGGESESSTPVPVDADQISEDTSGLATPVFLPARSDHGKQHTNMLEVSCANEITHTTPVPVEAEKINKDSSGWVSPIFLTARTGHGKQHTNKHEVPSVSECQYNCSICNKTFPQKTDLTVHMRVHTGERPYFCSICNKAFVRKSLLTLHMRRHTGDCPYSCSICNKAFPQKYPLTMHMRLHTGERPYSCSSCSKSFQQKSNLTKHMRLHTGERPFICSFCKKTFTRNSHLTVHMRLHTGERPHICSFCNKAFAQKSHLTIHMRVHTGECP